MVEAKDKVFFQVFRMPLMIAHRQNENIGFKPPSPKYNPPVKLDQENKANESTGIADDDGYDRFTYVDKSAEGRLISPETNFIKVSLQIVCVNYTYNFIPLESNAT